MSLTQEDSGNYLILYREVQSDDRLESDIIDQNNDITNIRDLINDVRDGVEDFHTLESLDVRSYFKDWVTTILANSDSLTANIDKDLRKTIEYLAEDFSDSMLSRAREKGKYVVFIISEGSLIAAHSFTGKKAITTDMTVIEELLSESNIDKFAEFRYDEDKDVIVEHYDRNDTVSFTNWLGIPEDEVAFNIKGDVRIYTEIDDIDVVFEFDEKDITKKLLGSDRYDLSDGMLKTPNEKPRRIERIRWGHTAYSDVDDFKQDLFKISHNLARAFDLYNDEISNSLDSFFDVEDHREAIIKFKNESTESISKPQVDNFELVYVNQYVDMHVSWRKHLCQNLLTDRDPLPICHAGAEFAEHPFKIGNFRIYNKMGLSEVQSEYITDLLKTAEDMGSANLRPLFTHVVFKLLSEATPKPLRYMFIEFANEFESQFLTDSEGNSRVIQTEGEQIDLEWKSPPWFERETSVDDIAYGMNKEFQSSRFLIIGISEDTKEIDPIESGVSSEKLNKIEEKLHNDFGLSDSRVWSIPIGKGHIIIALNVDSKHINADIDLSVMDRTSI
ncbi:hypothetical protein [Natronomonas sp. EA1]|uniref:hypothetical protein n=1 Tax=Natronomonas sp. EA1 TaxID=3421655 RepID=UPI003EBCBA00